MYLHYQLAKGSMRTMLRLFHSPGQLNKAQLYRVYEQSICNDGRRNYPSLSESLQFLRAMDDFYGYVDLFLDDNSSIYAVWVVDDVYCAALRIEGYRDGYLLSGLETALFARRKGYATALINAVQKYLSELGSYKLYSHVDKKNEPSLHVHKKCGFYRLLDYAVFIDGSVFHNSYTLCYEI